MCWAALTTASARACPLAANPRRAESTAGGSMETSAERARARDDAVSNREDVEPLHGVAVQRGCDLDGC